MSVVGIAAPSRPRPRRRTDPRSRTRHGRPAARGDAPGGLDRTAAAIVLTGEDDEANVDARARAQELNVSIRIVLRMFDPSSAATSKRSSRPPLPFLLGARGAGFVSAALDGEAGASFVWSAIASSPASSRAPPHEEARTTSPSRTEATSTGSPPFRSLACGGIEPSRCCQRRRTRPTRPTRTTCSSSMSPAPITPRSADDTASWTVPARRPTRSWPM